MHRLLEGVDAAIRRAAHGGIAASCAIDDAHPDFEGHFDARPVLPACSQFEILEALARAGVDPALTFAGVPRAKFLGVIDPGSHLEIELVPSAPSAPSASAPWNAAASAPGDAPRSEFEFTIARNGKIVTRGKIRFERTADPGGNASARPASDVQ